MPNDLMPGEKSSALTWYMRVIAASYVVLPFVTVIFWGLLVFTEGNDESTEESDILLMRQLKIAGASIGLLGLACLLIGVAIFAIRWNNYRFKGKHFALFVVALLFFTIW